MNARLSPGRQATYSPVTSRACDHGRGYLPLYDEQDFASAAAPLTDARSLLSDLLAGTSEQVKVLLAPRRLATTRASDKSGLDCGACVLPVVSLLISRCWIRSQRAIPQTQRS
jgi:hypothetical protein